MHNLSAHSAYIAHSDTPTHHIMAARQMLNHVHSISDDVALLRSAFDSDGRTTCRQFLELQLHKIERGSLLKPPSVCVCLCAWFMYNLLDSWRISWTLMLLHIECALISAKMIWINTNTHSQSYFDALHLFIVYDLCSSTLSVYNFTPSKSECCSRHNERSPIDLTIASVTGKMIDFCERIRE